MLYQGRPPVKGTRATPARRETASAVAGLPALLNQSERDPFGLIERDDCKSRAEVLGEQTPQ